ncbi:hypothetical protein PBY51_014019 [Eleginops maclovinus]|uniref:Uncharacterized protein n=1 Tax=Eleginops maclovinus TaxID=56733 RepID=A0AAN7WUW4_ELEMC|nr:hypothetical protein PBY51_014019 [Eleginops maclovinus]
MWVILSESQDNRKKAFSDRWMTGAQAGVGEGRDGRDTKPSTLTGRESVISQGAKPQSPAKARPRLRGAACDTPGGVTETQNEAIETASY